MHAVIFYPTEIITATAGFAYGWMGGFALAMTGWLLSALASYALGRWLGSPLLRSFLGTRWVAVVVHVGLLVLGHVVASRRSRTSR